MLYQLPNGKVIEISTEQYLELSDEELEYLVAYNYGETVENPWFGSVLSRRESASITEDPETAEDLTEIPEEDKLSALDMDFEPEEE